MSEPQETLDQIAIIGMAGRFPGAHDVDQFWDNLRSGREGITRLSVAEMVESGVDPTVVETDGYVAAKGVLDGADLFDPAFFGYSPREAELLDPQHRVFLECVTEALEHAGCVPGEFDGRIGIFAGAAFNTYLLSNVLTNPHVAGSAGQLQILQASDKDFLATRAAYKLGLRGPAMTVQTACSTSLTAVHLACQSLLNGECDIAVAGGVTVSTPLLQGYIHEAGGIASPDGHCRPFDVDSAGTVPGNGVGIVVLRRLDDARGSGDAVAAVILGTAVNNDGSLKAGYTAPSIDGQAAVISEALAVAGVGAETIGYVETHGTATALGDPIEIAALTQAFRAHTEEVGFCAIGSVKSSIGHLDVASGVAGLIKTVLMLQHGELAPSLHFTQPNPQLELQSSPFSVVDELRPWPSLGYPRRAGVSSFGIGGSNVHVVLQEAPLEIEVEVEADGPEPAEQPVLLRLSGKTPSAVVAGARRLADHLEAHPEIALDAVAHTLATRRRTFEHRCGVASRSRAEAIALLRRVGPESIVAAAEREPRVAFLFPGQGVQHVGMARDLYGCEPVFTAHVDRCAKLFAAELGLDLRELLCAAADDEAAAELLSRTENTQPAVFLVEYALAQFWLDLGVRPAAMVGHSIGEYVAACVAGVFSLEDAVRLVAARGRLMQSMPPGAMLTVFLPESEVIPLLGAELSLAAVNSTALCVVSGPSEAIDDLGRRLAGAGVSCRRLRTSHAFHSASMDRAIAPLADLVRGVERHAPRIPFCSNVTGTWITDEEATSPEYWGRHLRATVRFAAATETLLAEPSVVFLEVGPGHTLTSFVRSHASWVAGRSAVTSLRHPRETADGAVHVRRAVAGLWSAGVRIDPGVLRTGAGSTVVRLPSYPFERQRYWVEPGTGSLMQSGGPRARLDGSIEFSSPTWRRMAPHGVDDESSSLGSGAPLWVLLGDRGGLGDALAKELTDDGMTVVLAGPREDANAQDDKSWAVDPADSDGLSALLASVLERGPAALAIVHLASLGVDPTPHLDDEQLSRASRAGLDGLLALAQALDRVGPAVPVTIDVLCRGVHEVVGDEPLQPENATLVGLTTVIPQELSGVGCRLLDVTGVDPREPDPHAVSTVATMLRRTTEHRQLALRGTHWWWRDFDVVALPASSSSEPRLRTGGVYLITGGLGGIGLALAEHLAERVKNPVLALMGRSPFPEEGSWDGWLAARTDDDSTSLRIARLSALRDKGARIQICQADVTDIEQTRSVVARLRGEFGGIHGVIHAAGLAGAGVISGKSAADVDRVLGPKVRGTVVLDEACAGESLDFLLLCSSVTSVLGGFGQSDYCAANAFLDTFAHWKRQQGVTVVTALDWGRWLGIGMASASTGIPGSHAAGEPTGHPLLRRIASSPQGQTYATRLSTADSWIVADHRLLGHGLVPGTAYLELVRGALAERADGRVLELNDVVFVAPIVVPDGQERTVYTTLEERDERVYFTMRSRDDASRTWRDNAVGWASFAPRDDEPRRDLAQVRADCRVREVFDSEAEILRRARADRWTDGPLQFSVGPRWRVLNRLELGQGHVLATLRLADEFVGDLADYPLHPALLDMAVGVFRLDAEDPNYLPLSYGRLRYLGPLTATIYCHAWASGADDGSTETLTCDLELLDPDGRVLVQVDGYSVKRVHDLESLTSQVTHLVEAATTATDLPDAEPGILELLTRGMSQADGLAALDRVLAASDLPAQLVISAGDFAELRSLASSLTPELLAAESAQAVLATPTHPRPALDTPFVAPRTDDERAVAALWQEVLGVEPVGVDDDFFAIGGHSLAAVHIGTRVRNDLGAEFDLKDFYNKPTVAHLAGLLTASTGSAAADVIAVIDRGVDPDELDALSDDDVDAQLRELLAHEGGGLR